MLLEAIDAIDRRLAFRRAAFGAAVGGIAATPVAIVSPGAWWAAVLGGAAVGAFVAHRRRRRSLDWLERRDRGNDLIVSAAAVAGGSTRRTALADRVVVSGARAIDSLKPSLLPAVIAALALVAVVAVLAVSWVTGATSRRAPTPRPDHADVADVQTTEPGVHLAQADGPVMADARDGNPREHAREPSHAGAATPPLEAIGGVGSGASTTGRGDTYESSASIAAARAVHTADTSAPIAGASAALIVVPVRYRGLARAFLEAR
jgi:hypothetical protein